MADWPEDPQGDMTPILSRSIDAIEQAKDRHPSGGVKEMPTQEIITLYAADRCDACPAAAFYRLMLYPPYTLDMCKHHWMQHAERMMQEGWYVVGATP